MRAALIFGLWLIAPQAFSQGDGPPADIVAACIASGDREVTGLPDLEVSCPGIEHALVELGYSPFIGEAQLEHLDVTGLKDLKRLGQRYAAEPAWAQELATQSLDPILASMRDSLQVDEPPTLFERFKRWLREKLRRDEPRPGVLQRWLDKVSMPVSMERVLSYAFVILVIGLAAVVVINEMRAAGVLRRRGHKLRQGGGLTDGMSAAELTLADLDAAAPGDRPSVLLRLLVTALARSGRLRATAALTHRELCAMAHFDDESQRDSFRSITALSERALYGSGALAANEIDQAMTRGRALMSTIVAAPHSVPAEASR